MSATYRRLFGDLAQSRPGGRPLPRHRLANRCLDAVRRRVQSEQTGHRDERDDPLSGPSVLLTEKRSSTPKPPSVCGHCSSWATRTPRWPSPTASRSACGTSTARATPTRPQGARRAPTPLRETGHAARDPKARRTIKSWFDNICNFHLARVSNGPTEALNNLIKRIKRIGFASGTSRTTGSERCSTPVA